MKYERLTYKDDKLNDYIPVEKVETSDEFYDRFYNFCDRLGELEDKIENGELIEQKQSKLIPMWDDLSIIVCIECGAIYNKPIEHKKYCGNCGAKMKGN